MLWGNVATLPSTLLVRLCPAGHVSPYPQLVHLYAARKRQLDLIFAWKKRVFLWTSNNELRATSLMHSPSKYALSGNALPTPAFCREAAAVLCPQNEPKWQPVPMQSQGVCEDFSSKACGVRSPNCCFLPSPFGDEDRGAFRGLQRLL